MSRDVSAEELFLAIRKGADNNRLMTEFGLSPEQLREALDVMASAKILTREEVDARYLDASDTLAITPETIIKDPDEPSEPILSPGVEKEAPQTQSVSAVPLSPSPDESGKFPFILEDSLAGTKDLPTIADFAEARDESAAPIPPAQSEASRDESLDAPRSLEPKPSLGTLPGEPGAHPAAVQETDGSAQPGEYADKLAHEEPTAQHAANYRKNALFGVVGHFALMILGSGLQVYSAYQGAAGVPVSGIAASLSSFAMLGALCLGIWGCCCYAMYKGYHAALGLLGFLSCIGVLVLWILPNKRETFDTARKWSTALIVGAALIVILLVCAVAAVVPYVLSSRRAACDTEARSNLEQLNAAVQKLAAEAADMGVMWDQSALERLAREDGLKQLVGSHYGWSGGSTQCECVFRMQKHGAAWRIESAAGGGSRPGGAENRVIHGIDAFSGKAVRPTTGPVSASAQGAAQDWSAYPVQGSCYTESMVQAADSSRAFKIKSLKPVPCGDVSKDQGASAKSK